MPRSTDSRQSAVDPATHMHLAYAEASIMLIESLVLVLSERNQLALPDVIDAIETVIDTMQQQAENDDHARVSALAVGVLNRMSNSLAASKAGIERRDRKRGR